MAKKSSSNAIKKVDKQIKELKADSKDLDTTTVKTSPSPKRNNRKTTTPKKNVRTKRDSVVVVPEKKKRNNNSKTSNNTRKKTTPKNVRGGVVAPKRDITKTIEMEAIKNDIKSIKDEALVVVEREEKNKKSVEEVNRILEIEEPLDEVKEVKTPKFIFDEKPKEEKVIKDKEEKLREFFMIEDQETTDQNITLDDVDVIKFDSDKNNSKEKKGRLKKKQDRYSKTQELDLIDKLDNSVEKDIEKDIPVKKKTTPPKQDFSRKRKGKGYIVNIHKKPTYQDLEKDLRQLYDKVNDVVSDIDENENRKESKASVKPEKKKKIFSIFKKKSKTTDKVVKPKKVKVKKQPVIEELLPDEKPSILDHISQKVLNFFLIVLFVIFGLMVITFIGFIIYVSTF